jgi:hypothetical protein
MDSAGVERFLRGVSFNTSPHNRRCFWFVVLTRPSGLILPAIGTKSPDRLYGTSVRMAAQKATEARPSRLAAFSLIAK